MSAATHLHVAGQGKGRPVPIRKRVLNYLAPRDEELGDADPAGFIARAREADARRAENSWRRSWNLRGRWALDHSRCFQLFLWGIGIDITSEGTTYNYDQRVSMCVLLGPIQFEFALEQRKSLSLAGGRS